MDGYRSEDQLKKQRFFLRLKIYAGLTIFSFIGIGVFYLLAISPIFKLKNVEVTGNESLLTQEILSELKSRMPNNLFTRILGFRNYLVWSKNGPTKITAKQPLLAGISIDKDFWNQSVEITVQERQKYGIWCFNNSDACYWFDNGGVIFMPAPDTNGYLIIKIQDFLEKTPILGTKIIDERLTANFIKIIESLKNSDLRVKEFVIDHLLQELKTETQEGVKILFNLRFDPEFGISALKSLRGEVSFKNIEYIDLRVENRIYYKNR